MHHQARRTIVSLLLVTAVVAAVLWALPQSEGDGVFARLVQVTNENEGFFGFLAFLLSVAALLVGHGFRAVPDAKAPILEQNYLRQMEWVFQQMRQHPLGYTNEEIQSLQAELVEPVYRILKTVKPMDDGRTEKGRLTRNLVAALLRSDRPVVVLGDPGAGKSVALRQVGRALVRRGLGRRAPRLPVFLRLGTFTREIGPAPQESAREFIRESLRQLGGHAGEIAARFDEYLQEGRFVLLLDAMDEMPRADIQARFDALAQLQHFTGNKLLFACRKLDFRESFPFQRAIIQPFHRRQIRRFLDRALGELGRDAAREILSRANPLRDMASNPFFLKLLALFYQRRRALPASRAELMREYEAQVFDRARKRVNFPPDLSEERLRVVLSRLAYLTTRSGRGVTLRVDDLRRGFVPEAAPEAARLALYESWVESALEVARNENLLLVEAEPQGGAGATIVSFYHHRLQEYYTAVYLEELRPWMSWEEHLDDIWWQEILIMLFGITSDPEGYVRMLLGTLPAKPIVCRSLGSPLRDVLVLWGDGADDEGTPTLNELDPSGFYGLRRTLPAGAEEWDVVLGHLRRLGVVPPTVPPGDKDLEALGKLSAEPGRNEYSDWVRRWLEGRNSVLLDRVELAAECLRNAAGGAPQWAIQHLVDLISELVTSGNPWERVRSIQVASRLQGIDLYAVLEPALLHGDGWSRREAMEAISRYPLETSAYLNRAGFIVFLLFAREELLGSLPRLIRSLAERPGLARFFPGTLFLVALSLSFLLAPILFYHFLVWRFPDGLFGLDGALGLPWSIWSLILGALVTAWIYASKVQAGVPVLRATFTATSLCLTLPFVLGLFAKLDLDKKDATFYEELLLFPKIAGIVFLSSAALILPLVLEWLLFSLIAVVSFSMLWSVRILRVPFAYFKGPAKFGTYVEIVLGAGAILCLVISFVLCVSPVLVPVLPVVGLAILIKEIWVFVRNRRRYPKSRRRTTRELLARLWSWLVQVPQRVTRLCRSFFRHSWKISLVVLAQTAVFIAVVRGWVSFLTILIVVAAALVVFLLAWVIRDLIRLLVLYSRSTWGVSDLPSSERFDWYRDAIRWVRPEWARSLLWQEMAKSYKEMRQESPPRRPDLTAAASPGAGPSEGNGGT